MKHAHRMSNLANEDVDLVGTIDQTWSHFCGRATLTTFKFACKSICSFGETSKVESFFVKALFAAFHPLFGRVSGEELLFVIAMQHATFGAIGIQFPLSKPEFFLPLPGATSVVFPSLSKSSDISMHSMNAATSAGSEKQEDRFPDDPSLAANFWVCQKEGCRQFRRRSMLDRR